MEDILTVAVVNFHPEAGCKEQNLSRVKGFARAAARQGADLVLFPELCLLGYDYYLDETVSMEEKYASADTVDSPVTCQLRDLARQLGIYLIYGAAEAKDGKLWNSAYILTPQGEAAAYQKLHPFGAENRFFQKGQRPHLIETPWGPVGIGICYDSYQFPELIRYYVRKGARLYLNPTAEIEEIAFEKSRESFHSYYRRNLEYGAACNGIFIASANLTGYDRTSYFAGGSMVLGPKLSPFSELDVECYGGDVDCTREGIFLATIDLSLATRMLVRENPYGGGTDDRPELYRMLLEDC